MGSTARDDASNKVQSIYRTVNFNDVGIGTTDTVVIGTLPASAQICFTLCKIITAFNAVTTNVLTAGTSAGSDADVLGAADINEGALGAAVVFTGAGLSFAADTVIYAKYTQTGTAATTGQALIVICYVVPTH